MTGYLLRRTLGLFGTLFVVSLIVFLTMNVLPGDPATAILGIDASEEARATLRAELGLDRPVWQRYGDWVLGVVQGDFGTSYFFRVPVSELIVERVPLTLSLALMGMMATVILGITLGILAASNQGKPGDWAIMLMSQVGIAVPAFWLSILLVLFFAVHLRWLPPGGFPGWDEPWLAFRSLILPATALTLVQSAVLARVTRSSALEVMRLDFVRTARAKGLSRGRVLRNHILPNALIPVVTIIGLQVAGVVTGTIVIENVFYLPGLGRLVFQSIANRDLFTVQALVVLFAAIVVIANFIVDIVYVMIDPRLQDRLK
ncbi:ABC transporter permease [Aestuariivita sp.]|jgi:peptide/nickel transport system permease protein|uniref:ABC transporter permease n=1 Tax=Aestuariivita sp. TaxID=1872407 RepID=UPI00216C257A|nr:ABC transporter permease [Aestuariivita sp.]MCE8007328.1 ABC transporter permease [Aestuariivita sp.]